MFQKVLNEDDSESDDTYKIVIPRSKKKNHDTSQELLFQLIRQNQILSKTQKKMYRATGIARYIKLDLNNTQVKLDETKDKFKVCKKELKHARIENWIVRGLVLLYFLFQIYSFLLTLSNPFSDLF
jgi:hypothetical protein